MYIYGRNVVKSALLEGEKIQKIYIANAFKEQEIIDMIDKRNITCKRVSKEVLNTMVEGHHQGIVAEVADYQYDQLEDLLVENAFLVILDHLEDPHNFGAIIRTCEAAGVDGIIIPKDRSVKVNSTVIKVSTGAIENMKIVSVTNIVQTMEQLKKEGFWIVGTDMQGTHYADIDYTGKIAIVIGNEGKGMSKLTSETCDFIASIPMYGKTNSLNASVATGIIVFEAAKGRKLHGL